MRQTLVGEFGAWLAVAILMGVIVTWIFYLQIVGIDGISPVKAMELGEWVVLR